MGLIERDEVLDLLRGLLADAARGSGRVALIRGEAGIGKTSVVRQFVSEAGDAHILEGACDDLLAARPLGPFWDMALIEPALQQPLADEDRQTTFQTVLELLTRSLHPTLMVIEDAHWADAATLDLIKFVGRRIDRTHGLLVLTYRDEEVQGDHPLRVVMGDLPHGVVERIPLQPLTPDGVRQLAGAGLDSNALWELTGGNPFFVSEAVDSASESVPISIRETVAARVGRLSDEARALVELVSVVPRRIELTVVEEIFPDAGHAIAECEEAGILVVAADCLSFRHELARRAVEGDLTEIERRRLNLACLEACERLGLDIARLAHHAREAEDAESIIRILPDAARRASELQSHSEALANLRAMEPYLYLLGAEDLADHYDLWAFEEYLWSETGPELIDKAIELRRQLGDAQKLGGSLLVASRIAWVNAKRDQAVAHAREAAQVLEQTGGENLAMAYSVLSQLAMLGADESETIEYATKALDIVGDSDSRTRAHALNNVGAVTMMKRSAGMEDLEESFRISQTLGLPYESTRAAVNLGWGYLFAHDLDKAGLWIDRALEITEATEMPTFESYAATEKAMWHEARGEWDQAEAMTLELMDWDANIATSRATTTMVLARVNVRRGRSDAQNLVDEAMKLAEVADEMQRLGPAAAVMVEHAWLESPVVSDLDRPMEILDRSVALGELWIAGELAHWLRLVGAVDELPDTTPEPYQLLAEGRWRESADWWEARGLPYDRAVALTFGDVEARLAALEILDNLGAVPLAARVRSGLQNEGIKGVPRGPQRATRENELGLTARQSDVLDLIAADLTNSEIADRLFISKRTVDHHVSAILAKMGATNRTEAARLARELRAVS